MQKKKQEERGKKAWPVNRGKAATFTALRRVLPRAKMQEGSKTGGINEHYRGKTERGRTIKRSLLNKATLDSKDITPRVKKKKWVEINKKPL